MPHRLSPAVERAVTDLVETTAGEHAGGRNVLIAVL